MCHHEGTGSGIRDIKNTMKLSISVIIPSYNRCERVLQALTSVFAQTVPAGEVILIDDGSTDSTVPRVQHEFPNVIISSDKNKGVSAARNKGIELARNPWLAFLDSDDQWLPEKLERQIDAVAEAKQARFCHTDEIWIRQGIRVNAKRKHTKYGGSIFNYCLPLCCISPSSVLIHRSVFDELGGFDESLPAAEDYDFWLRYCCQYPVVFVDQALLIKHGGHDDQLSKKHWGMDRFRITALMKLLKIGPLTPLQFQQALEMLKIKMSIYCAGAKKRGRLADVRALEEDYEILCKMSGLGEQSLGNY